MDSLITAAGRALAAGDPLGALKRVALRDDAPDKEQAPRLEMACMRGVHPIAVLLERRPSGVERPRGPAQVTRDEGDLGLGDGTPRAGHGLLRSEGAGRAS